jgi:hypothetical protein
MDDAFNASARAEAVRQARIYVAQDLIVDPRVVRGVLAELDAARARVAERDDMLDAAHGLICNAHQKVVDDVTVDDGASPGWAEAARRWIDAYPPKTDPMTAPDRAAAVEIVTETLETQPYEARAMDDARAVATALDAAKLLRRPDEAAYVAALEALRVAVREHIENPSVPLAHPAVRTLRRALDAVPAAGPTRQWGVRWPDGQEIERDGEATLCVHCDAPILSLADTHCPNCGCPWDGD